MIRQTLIATMLVACVTCAGVAVAQRYNRCTPMKDLIEQHQCLMVEAISYADNARLPGLLRTPYVDINDAEAFSSKTYLQGAITTFDSSNPPEGKEEHIETIKILIDAGADANLSGGGAGIPAWADLIRAVRPLRNRDYMLGIKEALIMMFDSGVSASAEFAYSNGRTVCIFSYVEEYLRSAEAYQRDFGRWLREELESRGGSPTCR